MLTQMTSLLCVIILSSLAVSFQLGLEEVFFSPEDQTAREGEGVFFQCVSGESSAPASITWLKDEILVKKGRQIQGEYGGGNQQKTSGTLHLFNVTLEDDGIYVCVTHNPSLNISKRSRPARLTVLGVPRRLQVIQGPENITVAMGTEVSMNCTVHGFPVPMVHWFKDGFLLTNSLTSFNLQNNGQLLTFRNVTKADEGLYHCEASNEKESVRSQTAFLLPAEMDWSFIKQPTNLTVKRGENVTVTCRPPYSRPTAQVSWFKNNKLYTPSNHVSVLPTGDLFFHRVQEFDSGSYFCRASNILLQRFLTSRRAALTVLAPPWVKVWPQVLTVPMGARVVLGCQVSGHPLPSISWMKRGHSKVTGGRISSGLRNSTLYIQSARTYDEGVYVCEASNTLGQNSSGATLRVAVSPIIVTFVAQVSCSIGASVVLPCRAVGIQPITYTWTRGGSDLHLPISPNVERHIDEDGSLHISSMQYSDAGEYYCTAENRAGRHQRHILLHVTDEHHPADRRKQTTRVLSASTNTSKEAAVPLSQDSVAGQHLQMTPHPHIETQHEEVTCSTDCDATRNEAPTFLRGAVAELKMSFSRLLQQQRIQPTTHPTQLLVTQMQPPTLGNPPHPNVQSIELNHSLPETSNPILIPHSEPLSQTSTAAGEVFSTTLQYQYTDSLSALALTLPSVQLQDHISSKSNSKEVDIHLGPPSQIRNTFTESSASLQPTRLPVPGPFGFLSSQLVLHLPSPVEQSKTTYPGSVTLSSVLNAESHRSPTQPNLVVTETQFYQTYQEPTSTQISQTNLKNPGSLVPQKMQPSPTLLKISQSDNHQTFPQNFFPKFQLESSTIQYYPPPTKTPTVTKPQPSQIRSQLSQVFFKSNSTMATLFQTKHQSLQTLLQSEAPLPRTESSLIQHKNPLIIRPSISAIHPPKQTPNPPTVHPEIPVVQKINISDQVPSNTSRQGEADQSDTSEHETKLTEWLKRNTSQSPMTSDDPRVTQRSPSWLPVLEKHDIPIVVGVGVSLVFIFITVTFYSVVQKNEPAPTSRAAQRNLGVPLRHTERRAAGRMYENRAFEDDDCVAVIEQSPNTSDTRARPPGPSLVTVQMEPTCDDVQEDPPPTLDNHSVTVETYPEPILDTKIDPFVEEEKGCSLSQPSIHLQCAEDWTSNTGDNHSPCQDALPPPSSLPSHSASPSPPSRPAAGLRSSLTLQSSESCGAPIHHSLSISHGNPPLLLSHHVSLGLTTVAVDVHFYPAATVSVAGGTSTHINSVSNTTSVAAPLFGPPLVNSQEND